MCVGLRVRVCARVCVMWVWVCVCVSWEDACVYLCGWGSGKLFFLAREAPVNLIFFARGALANKLFQKNKCSRIS